MKTLVTLLTAALVVFFYLHITYQHKTNDDLELYEVEAPDKARLEQMGNLKLPFVFPCENAELAACSPDAHPAFELNVVDPSFVAVPLAAGEAKKLFDKAPYFTEGNEDFLAETLMADVYARNDALLRPPMTMLKKYDLILGGADAATRLKHSDHCRNYFYAAEGSVTVKLTPPRYTKFLPALGQFETEVDPWGGNVNPKIKFIDLILKKGSVLYVPAYWWYSFKREKAGRVLGFHYKTFMNAVATLPATAWRVLQNQNIKHVLAKSKMGLGPLS
jgi:hypothetical protein